MLTITAYPRLIAPMDLRPFLLGSVRYGPILFLQPLLDRGGALFIRLLRGLLGGEAPTLEIGADRSNRHPNPILKLNDLLHRLTCPQGKGEFQLIRGVVGDQLLNP